MDTSAPVHYRWIVAVEVFPTAPMTLTREVRTTSHDPLEAVEGAIDRIRRETPEADRALRRAKNMTISVKETA